MGKHRLVPHPDAPPAAIESVEVDVDQADPGQVSFRYRVKGAGLVLPARAPSQRVDGLWQTTCFELFLRPAGSEGYFEFNFSPSSQWAAYAFDSYREGRRDLPLSPTPFVEPDADGERHEGAADYVLGADVDISDLRAEALRMGLCAVIEETDGTKSYWALAHPPGKPDFHHPGCFTLELPPATS